MLNVCPLYSSLRLLVVGALAVSVVAPARRIWHNLIRHPRCICASSSCSFSSSLAFMAATRASAFSIVMSLHTRGRRLRVCRCRRGSRHRRACSSTLRSGDCRHGYCRKEGTDVHPYKVVGRYRVQVLDGRDCRRCVLATPVIAARLSSWIGALGNGQLWDQYLLCFGECSTCDTTPVVSRRSALPCVASV